MRMEKNTTNVEKPTAVQAALEGPITKGKSTPTFEGEIALKERVAQRCRLAQEPKRYKDRWNLQMAGGPRGVA